MIYTLQALTLKKVTESFQQLEINKKCMRLEILVIFPNLSVVRAGNNCLNGLSHELEYFITNDRNKVFIQE